MFSLITVAKSPLMEPGTASRGFVAPMIWRASLHGVVALDDHRHDRAGRDEGDELAEERLLGVLRVMPLWPGPRRS